MKKNLERLTALFLFLLPWQTVWIIRERFADGLKMEYETLAYYGTEVLLWAVFFLFAAYYISALRRRGTEHFRIASDRVFVGFLLAFLVWSYATSLFSADADIALQWSFHALEAVLVFFVIFLSPMPVSRMLGWFAAGSVAPAALGVYQFLTQSGFAYVPLGIAAHSAAEAGASVIQGAAGGRWLRAYGPFSHPNVFGGFMALAISASLLLLSNVKERGRMSVVLLALLVAQTAALVFSFSRSAWLGASLAVAVIFLRDKKKWKGPAVVIAVFLLCTALYLPLFKTRIADASALHEVASRTERVAGYRDALSLIAMTGGRGVGAGNYTIALRGLVPEYRPWEIQPAHNVFLLVLTELGIAGTALIFAAALVFVRWRRRYADYALLLPLAPIALFDHYLVSSYFGLVLTAVYMALVLRSVVPTLSTE